MASNFQITTDDVSGELPAITVTPRAGMRAGWEGGRRTRETANWNPPIRSADYDIRDVRETLPARCRWLVQNNAWCAAAQRIFIDNVIGEGILTKSNVKKEDGALDEEFNKRSDEVFARWLDFCHPHQEMNYGEMMRIGLASGIEAGNEFYLEVGNSNPNSPVPIAFVPFEQEQLDTSKDTVQSERGNEIRHGIERNAEGRVVGYHLFTRHPRDYSWAFPGAIESEFIPASRVIHNYRRLRPSQTLGVSWFAPVINAVWDTGEYMRSEIFAAKIASLFVAMERREDPRNGGIADGSANTDSYGNRLAGVARGAWLHGGPNDTVEFVQPNRPNSNATPWLEFMLNMIGAGVGLSYIRLTGDFSKTNFSSSRAADLQDRKVFKPLQNWHGWHVDLEIRYRVTRMAIALGKIPVSGGGVFRFNRNPERFLAAKIKPPGWGYVDPTKQVSASIMAIKSGLSTWTRELGEQGIDRDELFAELADDQKAAETAGLKLDLEGMPMGVQPEPEEPPANPTSPARPANPNRPGGSR